MAETWTSVMTVFAAIVWIVLILGAYIRLALARSRKLVRCPDSGAITFVDIEENAQGTGSTARWPDLKVKNCRLWPERKDCSRGCLVRCRESWGSYGVNWSALRPVNDHSPQR